MNLAKNLETTASFFPDRPAISEDLSETSYKQLNDRANRVATALLQMGIQTGDHVGLCAPNSGDWLAFSRTIYQRFFWTNAEASPHSQINLSAISGIWAIGCLSLAIICQRDRRFLLVAIQV